MDSAFLQLLPDLHLPALLQVTVHLQPVGLLQLAVLLQITDPHPIVLHRIVLLLIDHLRQTVLLQLVVFRRHLAALSRRLFVLKEPVHHQLLVRACSINHGR